MFDPTRGVDVGTKHQLYLLMRAFADGGGAILFHSTEIAELVNLCDRVLVMYGGRVADELAGEAISEEAIMRVGARRGRPVGRRRREHGRAGAAAASPPRAGGRRSARSRGLLVAVAVFVILLLVVDAITPGAFSYFELSFMSAGGATLALAAMGQTLVVLTGGFDLSTGAVVSLVNVVLATWHGHRPRLAGRDGAGGARRSAAWSGAFNGFFVAVVRLQPIVVTLSSMFIVQGITLLVMDKPGGAIAPEFSSFLAGDAIPNVLPAPIAVLLVGARGLAAGQELALRRRRLRGRQRRGRGARRRDGDPVASSSGPTSWPASTTAPPAPSSRPRPARPTR